LIRRSWPRCGRCPLVSGRSSRHQLPAHPADRHHLRALQRLRGLPRLPHKEEFTRTGDAAAAVEHGTGLSARVVTAAALIMFSVFAAFMVGGNSTIKAIGFSLAAGVLLDAFVVRLTLVPAVMSLAGGRIWYHPRWFARHVPDLDIEGAQLEPATSHAGPDRPDMTAGASMSVRGEAVLGSVIADQQQE
jgi:hypothetical protein